MMRGFFLVAFLLVLAAPAHARVLDIAEHASEKGIKFWLVEDHTLPVMALSFALKSGTSSDPADKQGVSQLLSNTMDEGAADMDAEAFQAALRDRAIDLSFNSSRDSFGGSLRTLTRHRDEAVRLLKISVNAPRFDAAPVERMKQANLMRIRSSLGDSGWIGARILNDVIYNGHPYALNSGGTLQSMAALGPDDLRAAHKRHFTRDRLVIGIAGDVTPADAGRMVDDIFGTLPEKGAGENLKPAPFPEQAQPVYFWREMPQTDIALAWDGIDEHDADYYAALVMEHIFGGGGFGSMLMEEVREKRGLTYGIYSSMSNLDYADRFFVQGSTLPGNAKNTVDLVQTLAASLKTTDVEADALKAAQDYLTGSLPLRFASSSGIAGTLAALQLMGRPSTALDEYREKILAITPADIKRAATRVFAKPPVLVLVGAKPEGIEAQTITLIPNAEKTDVKKEGAK